MINKRSSVTSCMGTPMLLAICLLLHLLSGTAYKDDVPVLGFVPLRIRDYAADLFAPPNQVISALKFVERLYGGDVIRLRQQFLKNINAPSQRDWEGFNVSREVLDISPSQGATTITLGSRGEAEANSSESLSASLKYFSSMDLTFKVYWTLDSCYKMPEFFNFTLVRTTVRPLAWGQNITVDQNWHLIESIYPQAAPVVARLPLSSSHGYTVTVQVAGVHLAPFVVEKENLLLSAMFHPLNARLWIHTAIVTNITQRLGAVDVVSVAINLVAANGVEEVTNAFMDLLICNQCLDGSARASFFRAFVSAGVNLTDVMLLSIEHQPGLTLQDQATAIGFPPMPKVPRYSTGDDHHSQLSAILGSTIALFIVLTVFLGALLFHRRRRARHAHHCASEEKSQGGECALTGLKSSAGSLMDPGSRRSLVSSVCSEADMQKWCLRNAMDANDIQICFNSDGTPHELGRGGFCKVLKGLHGGVREVALKMLLEVEDPERELARFTQELDLLRTLSFDSNIVQFYGASVMEGCPVLVLECMEGGDLCNAISNDRSGDLGWYSKGHKIALDVVRGLSYLHSCKCLHGDVTSRNILLNADHTVAKIGDLGLAKMMQAAITDANPGGTLAFAAPELLLNMRCNEKADVFSLGVVLWNICTQEVPLRGHLRRLQIPEECPASIAQLIDDCLEIPPEDRPSAKEAFEIIRSSLSPTECRAACCRLRTPQTSADPLPRQNSVPRPPIAPSKERCCMVSQRWQSVSGCSLSRLAPRDLCPAVSPSPPNPFHTVLASNGGAARCNGATW